jgi:hypothetical protein
MIAPIIHLVNESLTKWMNRTNMHLSTWSIRAAPGALSAPGVVATPFRRSACTIEETARARAIADGGAKSVERRIRPVGRSPSEVLEPTAAASAGMHQSTIPNDPSAGNKTRQVPSMRQSRRANTANRRDTVARRWRPWLVNRALESGPAPASPVPADVDDGTGTVHDEPPQDLTQLHRADKTTTRPRGY